MGLGPYFIEIRVLPAVNLAVERCTVHVCLKEHLELRVVHFQVEISIIDCRVQPAVDIGRAPQMRVTLRNAHVRLNTGVIDGGRRLANTAAVTLLIAAVFYDARGQVPVGGKVAVARAFVK